MGQTIKSEKLYIARKRHALHYLGVLYRAEDLYKSGGKDREEGLALFDTERANIERAQDWCARNSDNDEEVAHWTVAMSAMGANVIATRYKPQDRITLQKGILAASRSLAMRDAEAAALGNLANAYNHIGDVEQARTLHREGLKLSRNLGDARGYGQDLANLGLDYLDLNRPKRALLLFKGWLRVAEEMGDIGSQARALNHMGICMRRLQRPQDAIYLLERGILLAEQAGDASALGNLLGNLGKVHFDAQDYDAAIEYSEKAIAIHRREADISAIAQGLTNLSGAHFNKGNLRIAIEIARELVSESSAAGHPELEMMGHWNLAVMLHASGSISEAIRHAKKAQGLKRRIGSLAIEQIDEAIEEWQGELA